MSIVLEDAHQLIPHYRATGPHVLCVWHGHNEGNHIVIARSLPALLGTLPRVFAHHDVQEVREYHEVDIVLPPPEVNHCYAVLKAVREREDFEFWVKDLAHRYWRVTKVVPPGFRPCPGFASNGQEGSEDPYFQKHHIGCANCDALLLVADVDFESLHQKRKNLFREMHSAIYGRKPFAGQPSDPSRPLRGAWLDAGHHCAGVVTGPVAKPQLAQYGQPDGRRNEGEFPLLFFFHGAQKAIPAEISKLLAAEQERRESVRQQRRIQNDLNSAKRDKAAADLLLRILE